MVGVNKPVDSGRYLSKNNKIHSQWRFQLFIAFLLFVSGVKYIGFYKGFFLSAGFHYVLHTPWSNKPSISPLFGLLQVLLGTFIWLSWMDKQKTLVKHAPFSNSETRKWKLKEKKQRDWRQDVRLRLRSLVLSKNITLPFRRLQIGHFNFQCRNGTKATSKW